MNEKFRTIGLDTEDKITEFIDYIDDLEDTEEIKSDVYGFFEEESSYNENHIPAYVVMTKYKGKYIVWVEDQCCDFAISYPPYNLCDIVYNPTIDSFFIGCISIFHIWLINPITI